ncbi:MAG: CHAT domain-containing tetratricopeptide repeat protein [Chitinophagaceae bacterium]
MKSFLVSCLLFFSVQSHGQGFADWAIEAGALFQNGEYAKAILLAEKAAPELKKFLGEENVFYTGLLVIQASSHKYLFNYLISESLFLQVKGLIRKYAGEKSESYTACLHNLAGLYVEMAQYQKAEPLYLEALTITKIILGENSAAFASTLNSMSVLYEAMGQYEKAEPVSLQALAIRKKILGENDPNYATSLSNLAILYSEMGQYEKARILMEQAVIIREKTLGESHPDYATALNNLAFMLENLEKYDRVEQLYTQARDIRKRVLGENHPEYAGVINNLAGMYTRLEHYKKAEPLLIQANEIWKKVLGVDHPDYATGVNNLAAFYRKSQLDYNKSEKLYLEAIRLRKKILGEKHPVYGYTQTDLALLYSQMRKPEKAAQLLQSGITIFLENLAATFSILSEKEKGNFLDNNISTLNVNNSLLYNYPSADPLIRKNSLDLLLGFKSLALADTKNMLEVIRNSKDTSVKRVFNNWIVLKNLLAKQYTLPVTERMTEIKKLEDETETLEKELTRKSSSFRNQQSSALVSMQDIQKNMEPDEAAIEFINFKLYTNKLTDSIIYAAYVFRKNDAAPVFIPLCEKNQLKRLFDSAGKTTTGIVKNIYRGIDLGNNASELGISLYKLIWQPLEPYLKGIKKIAYSPSGRLYSIAYQALPTDSNVVLMDLYQLQQYTSTRQIAMRTKESALIKPGSIALFGDADFSMDSLALVSKRNGRTTAFPTASIRGIDNNIWPELPGTAEEIKQIRQLFENNKTATKFFVKATASEENLKGLNTDASKELHIATHGFFLPETNDKKKNDVVRKGNNYSRIEDPLLRSGLILAGGNYAWAGNKPVEGVEDGIVTAYEISQLDLSKTELLVLSACETGLGDVKGSEGVFGLQRAFKMAGVKKMIVSLWQVPDKETAELMISFYSYWFKGKTIKDAFAQAQADMRKKYSPFYWAAFVLVE